MSRKRTFYFNDARHFYLFVFDPPITMEDTWRPIDEVAGTAIDTFSYGVERGDGLFYPSKIGILFGEDMYPFQSAAYYRAWHNMNSLIDRGIDPLTVLIDRAHVKGMDFFASLRLGAYGGMELKDRIDRGGRGFANKNLRDHKYHILEELATQYNIEGVELDFAAAPGGSPPYFQTNDLQKYTPVMTEWLETVANMVRNRPGQNGQIGARIYPTESMNIKQGLDVNTWLEKGILDYVVPMLYSYPVLDPNMPFEWIVEKAHATDTAVYGMLHPYVFNESNNPELIYADPNQTRAVAASFWDRGVDGLYTGFMQWPLGDAQLRTLTELSDPLLIKEGTKHYVLPKRNDQSDYMKYPVVLPLEIPIANSEKRYPVHIYIADDLNNDFDRIGRVLLRLNIINLLSTDCLIILLNGQSLEKEMCVRDYGDPSPYSSQWLEFELENIRPVKGKNSIEISLQTRPKGMTGGIIVKGLEILIEYNPYPGRI